MSYGLEAAAALQIDPRRIFKTLVCRLDASPSLAVAVVPVAQQLDLKALAATVGAKRATLADATLAARSTGYVVGGISPLGQRTSLPTVIDTSARGFSTIMVSAGRRGLQMSLSPEDLGRLTGARFARIGV